MERIYSAFFNSSDAPADAPLKDSINPDKKPPSESEALKRQRQRRLRQLQRELRETLHAGTRVFVFAYGAKAVTAVLLASRKWSSLEYGYADALRLLLKKDTFRFAAFFGSLVGSYRLVELTLRHCRQKKDRVNNAVAGLVSGLAAFIDAKGRRETISLYLFIRALEIVCRHASYEGYLPKVPYSTEILFSLSNGPIMYSFVYDPSLISRSYYRWILNVGAMTHEGLNIVIRRWVAAKGKDSDGNPLPICPCQPHYHLESCMTHSFVDWLRGFKRALRIYVPVHILPAVLFRPQQIKQAPLRTAASLVKSISFSSSFLTSYQIIVKAVQCILRHGRQEDTGAHGWIAGMSSAVALFLEHPKRRAELMLYCLPRALDIVWKLLERKRYVRSIRNGEVFLFCISMALIMSSPSRHFKGIYLKIISFMFGKNMLPL